MKKIYFLLVFVFILGFVGNPKASGQCEYCQYPKICNIVNFNIVCNGNSYPITAVICYECTDPLVYNVQVLEFSYPDELERIMYDTNYQY
jgi:hypothetical protein